MKYYTDSISTTTFDFTTQVAELSAISVVAILELKKWEPLQGQEKSRGPT